MIPKPMQDPCNQCDRQQACRSSETYKCQQFHDAFVRAWDETAAFLRQQLLPHGKGG